MEFRIADTFQDSLGKLAGNEQKAVKLTVYDLQTDPSSPGLKFHRITAAKDTNFWSVRASRDLRVVVHKTADSFLLCYVDHHDDAYRWAEKRKIARHPRTGAAQIVEVRERVEEIPVYRQVEMDMPVEASPVSTPAGKVFGDIAEDDFLNYGVPQEWIPDVAVVTEAELLDLLEHLPAEAAEALLELAAGGTPEIAKSKPDSADSGFTHPDAQRRFRLIVDEEELALALEYPWEKWTVFLHPSQREEVARTFNGPAKVAGSAGTGKTVVAIHRAVHLAKENPEAKVLLTTFSGALASLLEIKLHRLIASDSNVANRIVVRALPDLARELHSGAFSSPEIAENDEVAEAIREAAEPPGETGFTERFLRTEWRDVVDAWQIEDWETYRDVQRLGRKTRLAVPRREAVWKICLATRERLRGRGLTTWPEVYRLITESLADGSLESTFDYAVVDEAQDLGISELRFLAALCPQPDGLFFAGDLGQRIFQQPFSWKSLGIDIRGRSRILRVNYRTSHQIRENADRLLPETVRDADGNEESRTGAVSVFSGPEPEVRICNTVEDEIEAVAELLLLWRKCGIAAGETGLFVRSEAQLPRARAILKSAGVEWCELERTVRPQADKIALSTMHLAKGLEFRAVVAMACDDEVIPLQDRVETIADEAELEEVYATERHLLYVAATRARERLFLSGVDPASEFLDDFRGGEGFGAS